MTVDEVLAQANALSPTDLDRLIDDLTGDDTEPSPIKLSNSSSAAGGNHDAEPEEDASADYKKFIGRLYWCL